MKTLFLCLSLMACGGVNTASPAPSTGHEISFICDSPDQCVYRGMVMCPKGYGVSDDHMVFVSRTDDNSTWHGHMLHVVCK